MQETLARLRYPWKILVGCVFLLDSCLRAGMTNVGLLHSLKAGVTNWRLACLNNGGYFFPDQLRHGIIHLFDRLADGIGKTLNRCITMAFNDAPL